MQNVHEHVWSPSLGIRWCKKKGKTWANLWVWSFLPLICPLSFQLSVDCEVGPYIQVTVCSSFWKSYAISVIKQYFYLGHQKTLHDSKLYITTCCVERTWMGLHFLWVLLGSPVEKQRLALLILPCTCDYWLWGALISWCLLLPWTVLKSWTFLSSWLLRSTTCLCSGYRLSLA